MIRILWSPQSLRDLQTIQAFIARDSALYAELVVRRIAGAVERLAVFPESGRSVPERSDRAVREIIVRPYRVVYRLRQGFVEIATVFCCASLPS